jgi:hypothetical protein
MAVIESLNINLAVLTAGLKKGLDSGRKMIGSFSESLKTPLGALAAAAGGVFAVDKISDFVFGAIDAADNLATIATELGTTADAFNQLRHAAALANVSQEQLLGGFEKLERTLGEARSGNETAAKSFEALGVSVDSLKNKAPDQVFLTMADAIAAIKDPAERAAAVVDVFGKSGMKLIPLLAQGSKGIEEVGKQVAGIYGEQRMAQFAAADAALDDMNESWLALKTVAGAELAPIVAEIAKGITSWASSFLKVKELAPGEKPGDDHSALASGLSMRSSGNFVAGQVPFRAFADMMSGSNGAENAMFRSFVQGRAASFLNGQDTDRSKKNIEDLIGAVEALGDEKETVEVLKKILKEQTKQTPAKADVATF